MGAVVRAIAAAALFMPSGCTPPATPPQPADHDQITQVSIINALMLAEYDGIMPIGKLLTFGDFGLGTCDHLDGELIVLDGKAFQAKADGTVAVLSAESTTPFAVITPFESDGQLPCSDVGSLAELEARLDGALANPDLFFAIRVDGTFRTVTFRSVPRQEPPYVPLAEVAKGQAVWTHQNLKGTLIAIRCPKWVTGLNVPGYHWHFISADRQRGGHALDCAIADGAVLYDRCAAWLIKLNPSAGSGRKDLSIDLSRELEQVERQRSEKRD